MVAVADDDDAAADVGVIDPRPSRFLFDLHLPPSRHHHCLAIASSVIEPSHRIFFPIHYYHPYGS